MQGDCENVLVSFSMQSKFGYALLVSWVTGVVEKCVFCPKNVFKGAILWVNISPKTFLLLSSRSVRKVGAGFRSGRWASCLHHASSSSSSFSMPPLPAIVSVARVFIHGEIVSSLLEWNERQMMKIAEPWFWTYYYYIWKVLTKRRVTSPIMDSWFRIRTNWTNSERFQVGPSLWKFQLDHYGNHCYIPDRWPLLSSWTCWVDQVF